VTRLARVGFDRVGGHLRSAGDALADLGDEVAPASRLTAAQLRDALRGDAPPLVIDVRSCGERSTNGQTDETLHIPPSDAGEQGPAHTRPARSIGTGPDPAETVVTRGLP